MIFAEENRNIQRFLFDSFEHCARTVFMKITPVAVAIILLLSISHFLTITEKKAKQKLFQQHNESPVILSFTITESADKLVTLILSNGLVKV